MVRWPTTQFRGVDFPRRMDQAPIARLGQALVVKKNLTGLRNRLTWNRSVPATPP